MHRTNCNKATDAAAGRSPRIKRGNHRLLHSIALLLAAAPRPSSAHVLTKTNLGKAGGVASAAGDGGQPFEPFLPEELFDRGDAEVDANLDRDATTRGTSFKFGIDGSIDDEEGNSVSLFGCSW